jgi:hypothetical protein
MVSLSPLPPPFLPGCSSMVGQASTLRFIRREEALRTTEGVHLQLGAAIWTRRFGTSPFPLPLLSLRLSLTLATHSAGLPYCRRRSDGTPEPRPPIFFSLLLIVLSKNGFALLQHSFELYDSARWLLETSTKCTERSREQAVGGLHIGVVGRRGKGRSGRK